MSCSAVSSEAAYQQWLKHAPCPPNYVNNTVFREIAESHRLLYCEINEILEHCGRIKPPDVPKRDDTETTAAVSFWFAVAAFIGILLLLLLLLLLLCRIGAYRKRKYTFTMKIGRVTEYSPEKAEHLEDEFIDLVRLEKCQDHNDLRDQQDDNDLRDPQDIHLKVLLEVSTVGVRR